jgi:hypothetical protein
MAVKNFTLQDITKRIMLSLPSRFTREEQSNVYKFFESIADVFQINTNKIDELITQTNLETASGAYLDQYISGLAGFGRLNSTYQAMLETEDNFDVIAEDTSLIYLPDYQEGVIEDDGQYRDRYQSTLYRYNSTRSGLTQIIVDFAFEYPIEMYAGTKRGAYYSNQELHAKSFFNDSITGKYGAGSDTAFIGYIELSRKPNQELIEILCGQLAAAKAWGIKLYLKYPLESLEFNFAERVICRSIQESDNKTLTDENSVTASDSLEVIFLLPNAAVVGTAIVGVSFVG